MKQTESAEIITLNENQLLYGNQGRTNSQGVYPYHYKNFLFRKDYEKFFFISLENYVRINCNPLSIIFTANSPWNYSNGEIISRFEPDIEVTFCNKNFAIEIDGSSHYGKTPEEEQMRLWPLEINGFRIIRLNAPDPSLSLEDKISWSKSAVKKTFCRIKKYLEAGV